MFSRLIRYKKGRNFYSPKRKGRFGRKMGIGVCFRRRIQMKRYFASESAMCDILDNKIQIIENEIVRDLPELERRLNKNEWKIEIINDKALLKRVYKNEEIVVSIHSKSDNIQFNNEDKFNIELDKEEVEGKYDYFEVLIKKKNSNRFLNFHVWTHVDTLDLQSLSVLDEHKNEINKVFTENLNETLLDKLMNLLAERSIKESFIKIVELSLNYHGLCYERDWMKEVKNFIKI